MGCGGISVVVVWLGYGGISFVVVWMGCGEIYFVVDWAVAEFLLWLAGLLRNFVSYNIITFTRERTYTHTKNNIQYPQIHAHTSAHNNTGTHTTHSLNNT